MAGVEVRLVAVVDERAVQFREPGDVREEGDVVGELTERGPAPQAERGVEARRRAVGADDHAE